MENRRTLTWFLLFVALWLWVGPRLFPNLFPKPAPKAAQQQADVGKVNEIPAVVPGKSDVAPTAELAKHPNRKIVLGPKDGAANTDMYLRVTLTTQGAATESAELLDPRYTTLDRKQPL